MPRPAAGEAGTMLLLAAAGLAASELASSAAEWGAGGLHIEEHCSSSVASCGSGMQQQCVPEAGHGALPALLSLPLSPSMVRSAGSSTPKRARASASTLARPSATPAFRVAGSVHSGLKLRRGGEAGGRLPGQCSRQEPSAAGIVEAASVGHEPHAASKCPGQRASLAGQAGRPIDKPPSVPPDSPAQPT